MVLYNEFLDISHKKNGQKICQYQKKLYLCTRKRKQGTMAEWLGTGLQNLLQQFESAWYLNPRSTSQRVAPFSLIVFTAFYCPLLHFFCERVHFCCDSHFNLPHHGRKIHHRSSRLNTNHITRYGYWQ